MDDRVHFLPVGFDFERLIRPIGRGELEADRVVLITHEGDPSDKATDRAAQLAGKMGKRLKRTFDLIDIEVEQVGIDLDTIYQYESLYPMAHEYILAEINDGNEVYVNISSMPRTVAFAFATAADSLINERQDEIGDIRDRIHTYYVAPERYLVLDMIEALEQAADAFEELKAYEDLRVHQYYENVKSVLDRINESGVTEGTRDDLNGQMFVEFPASPASDVEGFEEIVLRFLGDHDAFKSTSVLAEKLAIETNEMYDDSFRSRVQYNVSKLEKKGYISRLERGNRLETQLSTMGEMWLQTH